MNVFDLFASLSLDSSDYDKGLDSAEKKGSSFGGKLKKGLGTAAKVGGAALAATGAAAIGAGKKFLSSAGDVATYGDNIDKMSQKMNMSAETYQEWDFVMQHCGSSVESLKSSIKTLSSAADKGGKIFDDMGLSEEKLASMSGEELFGSVITYLQQMDNEVERTAIASKLLGRGATELGALFNMTAEETAKMKEEAHTLGGVMSNESVKAAAQYQDSLQNMNTAMTGMKNNMMAEFLPALSTTMDGLSKVFSGNDVEKGMEEISTGVGNLATEITKQAPKFIAIAGNIITSVVSAFADNAPTLLKAGADALVMIINGIVENIPKVIPALVEFIKTILDAIITNLPTLVKAGVEILKELSNAIVDALPTLIPAIVDVILEIVKILTDPANVVPLIQAGLQIIVALVQGILDAIPVLIEALPTIIDNIVTTLVEGIPLIIDAAIQLLMGIVDAIPVIIEALVEALPQIIQSIITGLLEAFPKILEGAIQLLMALIAAIPKIILALVENLPKIITAIITTLLENLPKLIEAAVQLFMALIKAIPLIIIELIKHLPEIIEAIVTGLGEGFKAIFEIGKELLKGLWEGIKSAVGWIKDKIKGVADTIVGGFKNLFGIHSPSKVMRDKVGKFIGLGVGVGIEEGLTQSIKGVEQKASALADAIGSTVSAGLDMEDNDFGSVTVKESSKKKSSKTTSSKKTTTKKTTTKASKTTTASSGMSADDLKKLTDEVLKEVRKQLSNMTFTAPIYIGGRKIDQQIVTATAKSNVISGGR